MRRDDDAPAAGGRGEDHAELTEGTEARATSYHGPELAHELYGDHPAAAALLREAVTGASDERRRRSARALRLLDLREPCDSPALWAWGEAARELARWLILSTDRRERTRLAGLLTAVFAEAEALSRNEAAA